MEERGIWCSTRPRRRQPSSFRRGWRTLGSRTSPLGGFRNGGLRPRRHLPSSHLHRGRTLSTRATEGPSDEDDGVLVLGWEAYDLEGQKNKEASEIFRSGRNRYRLIWLLILFVERWSWIFQTWSGGWNSMTIWVLKASTSMKHSGKNSSLDYEVCPYRSVQRSVSQGCSCFWFRIRGICTFLHCRYALLPEPQEFRGVDNPKYVLKNLGLNVARTLHQNAPLDALYLT